MFLLLQCTGEMPGICLLWQNCQCNIKHNRLRGKLAVVLPTGCPRRKWLLAGISWTKSQRPHFWGGGGGGGIVTNDLCIRDWRKVLCKVVYRVVLEMHINVDCCKTYECGLQHGVPLCETLFLHQNKSD